MMTVKRIAVAVRAMDMITGNPAAAGDVRIAMADGAAGIRKNDGYVIFWDNGMPKRCLIAESPYYEREEILIDLADLRRKRLPAINIWLKPAWAYPYAAGQKLTIGQAEPNQPVRILMKQSEGLVRLSGSYPLDKLDLRLIELQVPRWLAVEGRPLRIQRLSDGHWEDFTIWQACNESAGLYELAEPLKEIYSVYDEAISLLLEVRAAKDGRYQVPVMAD